MLHNDIVVKSAIEREINNKFEIRFWLEMPVNGKTAQSRGTLITVEKPSLEDARSFSRNVAEFATIHVENMEPKQAVAALDEYIKNMLRSEKQIDFVFQNFDALAVGDAKAEQDFDAI